MTFEIGTRVKWSSDSPMRLGFRASEIGQVVRVHEYPAQCYEIDVKFDNGEIVRGALVNWFEPAMVGRPD